MCILPFKPTPLACVICVMAVIFYLPAFANHRDDRPAPVQMHADRHEIYVRDFLLLARGDEQSITQRKAYYQSLPKDEQERIRRAHEEYERLPPEEKQKIRKRWEQTPDREKNKYKKWKKDKYRD